LTDKSTYVLGISCYYHDSAAALIKDGEVVAAAQEERFDRDKYSNVFPIRAINYCLGEADVTVLDVDYIAFYEKPFLKFLRVIMGHLRSYPWSLTNYLATMPTWLEDKLIFPMVVKRELGYEGPVLFFKHHLTHAASAFFVSPFEEAALLTVDGIGEWASATIGTGRGTEIELIKEMHYPNSLGLLYAIVTTYLGFRVFEGEGKVMALAAMGEPRYVDEFAEVIEVAPDGSFRLNPRYFNFNRGSRMYRPRFTDLLGSERAPDGEMEQRHLDVAATLQHVTEEVLVKLATNLYEQTHLPNLCLAGGVFLNVTANTRLLNETPFEELFIQPAAGDAGAALGAASYLYHAVLDRPRTWVQGDAYLGPQYPARDARRLLQNADLPFEELEDDALVERVAEALDEGLIVAWFQGRMEWGPRALGARSILADCRDPEMKDKLNNKVKHREEFRPYGVSLLEERAAEWFDLHKPSPYMLLVGNVLPERRDQIPSALHVDDTCRLQTVNPQQNPLYHALLEAFFERTGVPMFINTSFNSQEPIVCTPAEALDCFLRTEMDCLAMGPFFVTRP